MTTTKYDEAIERYLAGERIVDIEAALKINRQSLYNKLRDRGIVPSRPRGRGRRIIRLDEQHEPTSVEGLLQRLVLLQQRVEMLEQALETTQRVSAAALATPIE